MFLRVPKGILFGKCSISAKCNKKTDRNKLLIYLWDNKISGGDLRYLW